MSSAVTTDSQPAPGGTARRLVTIVNGAAGGGRCKRKAPAAIEQLREAGFEPVVTYTAKAGHAKELAREAYEAGERAFLSVGGDGTMFEVLNGIFPRPEAHNDAVYLGALPLGTGNSFMRDFGVTDAESAMAALCRGSDQPADVVRVHHQDGVMHYINLLSIGFTAAAGAMTNRRFKPLGMAGYALAVMLSLVRLKNPCFPLRLDEGEANREPCTFLSFSNSRCTGGTMKMAPQAEVADGRVDVIRVDAMSSFELLRAFPSVYRGEHVQRPKVHQSTAAVVTFEEPVDTDVMVDGEICRLTLKSLEVIPGAVRILA